MIHVIMGQKGTGKTKKLLDAINQAVAEAHGDVVCIEYGRKLTYDVSYKVRLVDSQEYAISTPEMLKGFLSGRYHPCVHRQPVQDHWQRPGCSRGFRDLVCQVRCRQQHGDYHHHF